jgi:hypothetical protein
MEEWAQVIGYPKSKQPGWWSGSSGRVLAE